LLIIFPFPYCARFFDFFPSVIVNAMKLLPLTEWIHFH